MNKNRTVSAGTITRTAVLALALINQLLSALGKPVLPIESAQLEQMISTGFTTVSALVNWWYNNSFTPEAIEADAFMARMKKRVR
jgi:SPP1 family holin